MDSKDSQENKVNKIVFVLPVVVLLVSFGFYALYMSNFNNYGQDNLRLISVMNHMRTTEDIDFMFLGDSQVRENIDCNLIKENISKNCFNYGVPGVLPVQLLLMKDDVIKNQPEVVFVGLSPMFFSELINKNDDFFYFIGKNHEQHTEDELNLLNELERELLQKNKLSEMLYLRKFVMSAYSSLLKTNNQEVYVLPKFTDMKTPFVFYKNQTEEELKEKLEDGLILDVFDLRKAPDREMDAFVMFVKELKKNNIKVVAIDMPLNPLLDEKISVDSRINYKAYLSYLMMEQGVDIINIDNLNSTNFLDLSHLNSKGRKTFSTEFVSCLDSESDSLVLSRCLL
jgi:hypothetical protein